MNSIFAKLVEQGLLTPNAAQHAHDALAGGKSLDDALREAPGASEDKMLRFLAVEFDLPFIDLENPDVVVFLRSFPTLEAREEMKTAFYEGDLWKNELEGIAMPMIESYAVVLTEADENVTCFE